MGGSDPLDARAVIGGGGFGGIGSPRELIGRGTDASGTAAVLDRCLDLGVTIIDTAHSYAGGESHRMIGTWLAADPTRRTQVAIADKVGIVDGPGRLAMDLSPATVLRCAAEGRRRMGVDTVDVIMIHGKDSETPVRQTLGAFAQLLEQGRARHWGLSNVDAGDLQEWIDEADRLGAPPPYVVENELNLLARGDEREVLPMCRAHGVRYFAFSPLAGGVLTGKYRRGQAPPLGSRVALRPDSAAALVPDVLDRVDLLADRAASYGVSPAGLGLAWVLAQQDVAPVAGASNPSQLDALAEALTLDLSPDDATRLAADLARDD
jgi:aryl-alcohol dehydrogenase-like predicted oxidoreductase